MVQQQGLNKVSVDLPGVQDTARAKEIIGKTASLRFQMVDDEADLTRRSSGCGAPGTVCMITMVGLYLLKNEVILQGSSITYATASMGENGRPTVNVRFRWRWQKSVSSHDRREYWQIMAVIYVETKTRKN